MKWSVSLFFIFLLVGSNIFAQTDKKSGTPLTPEAIWKIPRISEEQVSPDGKKIVFGVTNYEIPQNKGNKNLFVYNIENKELVQITDWPGSEMNPRWRPDGKRIGFLSAKSGSMQLWEIGPDGSTPTQVSNWKQAVSGFSYAPTQDKIAFIADIALDKPLADQYSDLPLVEARLIDDLMYRHWDSWHDFAYSHVFLANYQDGRADTTVIDLLDNQRFDSPVQPQGGIEQIAWKPDGKAVAYCSKKLSGIFAATSTNSDIYLYDCSTKQTTNLSEGGKGYDLNPVFAPDGKSIIWESQPTDGCESEKNTLIWYSFSDKVGKPITENFPESASDVIFDLSGDKIYFLSGLKATIQIYELTLQNNTIRKITDGKQNYNSLQKSFYGLVAQKTTMSQPTELFLINPSNGQDTRLTTATENVWGGISKGEVRERWVTTTDGKQMLVWVVYPPNFDSTKKYPAILYCQGGPQSTVNQFFSYRWNFQLFAAQGYIVVAPNRRGLPSFGQEWNDAISGDWGGQPMQDYLSAIDNICTEKYIDKNRLGAVGASYGGYSVYYLAGIHNKRFKVFISHCGLFNMESWYGSTEELFFANWDLRGNYWSAKQNKSYTEFSPHRFVQNWDTPILVIHGEKDFRVPVNQGIEAFQAAKLRGIPAQFLYFPDEGHWVLKPQNSILWSRIFIDWLDKWLK